MIRAYAALGYVPGTMQHLERLHVLEPRSGQPHDELLDLRDGRQVRAHDRARAEDAAEGLEGRPGLGQIEHGPIEGLPLDLADVALPELERVGDLPEEGLDVPRRGGEELGTELVAHHPALGTGGPAQGDRERARAGARLEHPRARGDVAVDQDRAD